MDLEWDAWKAEINLRKHNVDFAEAAVAIEDDRAITTIDEDSGEVRFVTLGIDILGRVLVVVFTVRQERVRLISARRADARERRRYQER
jgi:uncharacterized DUF497 family protein